MSRPGLGWYVRRLRRMSVGEVAARGVDAARRRRWASRQVRVGDVVGPPPDLVEERAFASPVPADAVTLVPADAARAVIEAADAVLAGTWTVFGTARADCADPDWFLDPLTGRRAPADTLAFRVHHRDEAQTGNVKQVWEMSRHHHITVLAAAWWLTREERYAEAAARQLRDWWRANPLLSGVHWTSGIEAAIRLISWVWTRRLLDDWPKVGDLFEHNDDALRQLVWHQEFLAAFPSRGSSANNHVIAEAAGRLAAACAFPWFGSSAGWRTRAAELLERELDANTFEDGLNRELATDYHRFVLELGLVAAAEADAAGHELSEATWQCLARMLDAGCAVLDVTGRPPRQGDGDEGRALVVDDPEHNPWGAALATGAALMGGADWWPSIDGSVQACVVGALGTRRELPRSRERPHRFRDAGMVLLRSQPGDGAEIWCRCDGGPHGYLSIAGHAHADALSVEVRHDGVDILADPGTYCYHGEPEWRAWFRSTAAHNTVQLDGVNQAESGGPFLWLTHPRTRTIGCDIGDQPVQTWSAEHDGYLRLRRPAVHRRTVALDSPARRLTVTDVVEPVVAAGGNGQVAVVLSWHLGPAVRADLGVASALLTWQTAGGPRQGRLLLPDVLAWTAHTGETDPVGGWYSSRFGHRVPTTTLTGRGVISSAARLETALHLP